EKYGVCNHTANNQRWPGGSLWAWRPGFGVNGTQAVQDPDPTEFVHNYAAIFTNGNCVSLPGNPHHSLRKFQIAPASANCDPHLAQSGHVGGITVGMGDGHVRFIGANVSEGSWHNALTPNGNDIIGRDWDD